MGRAIGKGLLVSLTLVVAVLILNAGLTYLNLRRLSESIQWVTHTSMVMDSLENVLSLMKDVETGQRGYLITGDSRFLEPYHAAVAALPGSLQQLKHLTADNPQQQARIPTLEQEISAKLDMAARSIALRKSAPEAAERVVASGEGRKAMDSLRTLVAEMEQEEQGLLHLREGQAKHSYRVTVVTGLVTTAVGLGMVVAFGYLLRRHLAAREEAAAVLHSERARLEAVLRQMPSAAMIVEAPSGRLLLANEQFTDLIGSLSPEAEGGPMARRYPIFHPDGRLMEREEWPLTRVIDRGETVLREENIYQHDDGSRRILLASAAPIRDGHDRIIAAALILEDVTERKAIQAELERHREHLEEVVAKRTAELAVAKERAEESDRLKSAFLATMSHELRTPLNSIIGFTGILLQGLAGPLAAEQTKQLTMVRNSARHLLDLINDVLDLSKIEAGQLEVAQTPFEMRAAIEKALQTVAPLAQKKGLGMVSSVAPDVGQIVGDRRRVEQILLNLMNNAIKFTEKGEVRVECAVQDSQVVTRVVDTGPGIQSENLARLFKPFSQVDTGLARRYEGTGLGLSICKRLVEMLGGEIFVESQWGQGSTFTFTLPKASQGAST